MKNYLKYIVHKIKRSIALWLERIINRYFGGSEEIVSFIEEYSDRIDKS